MFGQTSGTQREFFATAYSKTLQPLFRCLLKVVLYPGVISLGLLCVLYSIAEYTFTDFYFALGYVWKPAFPLTWRIVFLSLFVVPALAFIQLLWLSLHRLVLSYHLCRCKSSPRSSPSQGYMMLPRSESNSLEEGALSGTGDDEDCDLADIAGDTTSSTPRTPSKQQAFPFVWFFFWLAILCTSLWFVLHYRHPGDLRYLQLIEHANTHPKREGYANKGNATCRHFVRDHIH